MTRARVEFWSIFTGAAAAAAVLVCDVRELRVAQCVLLHATRSEVSGAAAAGGAAAVRLRSINNIKAHFNAVDSSQCTYRAPPAHTYIYHIGHTCVCVCVYDGVMSAFCLLVLCMRVRVPL